MGGKMSKPELRKRGARVHPAAEEEALLEDYVHVTAEEAGPAAAEPLAPSAASAVAAVQRPLSAPSASGPGGGGGSLQAQLARLWRGLVAACLRTWNYVRDALLWCLGSLGLLPAPAPRLSLVQQERLQDLQDRLAVPYSPDSPTHQAALRALWEAAFPGELFPPGVKSERWKDMGWQSDDPGRDFRAAGASPLDCLLYMAQREEATFRRLMGKTEGHRAEWEYPFGAAGVNLAFMLSEVLDLRRPAHVPATAAGRAFLSLLAETDTAFEEAFVAAYVLLDRVWLEQRASYMEFPLVLKAVRQRVERALGGGVGSMEELQQRLLAP